MHPSKCSPVDWMQNPVLPQPSRPCFPLPFLSQRIPFPSSLPPLPYIFILQTFQQPGDLGKPSGCHSLGGGWNGLESGTPVALALFQISQISSSFSCMYLSCLFLFPVLASFSQSENYHKAETRAADTTRLKSSPFCDPNRKWLLASRAGLENPGTDPLILLLPAVSPQANDLSSL